MAFKAHCQLALPIMVIIYRPLIFTYFEIWRWCDADYYKSYFKALLHQIGLFVYWWPKLEPFNKWISENYHVFRFIIPLSLNFENGATHLHCTSCTRAPCDRIKRRGHFNHNYVDGHWNGQTISNWMEILLIHSNFVFVAIILRALSLSLSIFCLSLFPSDRKRFRRLWLPHLWDKTKAKQSSVIESIELIQKLPHFHLLLHSIWLKQV